MTTNDSSDDDNNKKPRTERVEVRRVEADDQEDRRSHVSIHPVYGGRGVRARLHLSWRAWLSIIIAALVIIALVALALTVLIWILPVVVIVAAALLVARWVSRAFGGRR